MNQTSTTARSFGLWVLASIAAVLSAVSFGPVVGLLVAVLGGAAFGVSAARRLDAQRIRERVRRRRSTPRTDGG